MTGEHHHHVLIGEDVVVTLPDRFVCVGECFEPSEMVTWGGAAKEIEHEPCLVKNCVAEGEA